MTNNDILFDIKEIIKYNNREFLSLSCQHIEKHKNKGQFNEFIISLFNQLLQINREESKTIFQRIEEQIKPDDFSKLIDEKILLSNNTNFDLLKKIQNYLTKGKNAHSKNLKDQIQKLLKSNPQKNNSKENVISKKENLKSEEIKKNISSKNEKHNENYSILSEAKVFQDKLAKFIIQINSEKNTLTEQLNTLEKQNKNLNEKNKHLTEQLKNKEEDNNILKNKVRELNKSISEMDITINKHTKTIQTYQDANQTLQSEANLKKEIYIKTLNNELKIRYDEFQKYGKNASQDELYVLLEKVFNRLKSNGIKF